MLSCEHAGGEIPTNLGRLGLSEAQLERCEGGVDLGAAELFAFLVRELDCFGILNRICRLVIDVNRYETQADLIPTHCGPHSIPANAGLDEDARRRRVELYHRPYHRALHGLLDECERRHGRTLWFLIHTMAARHEGESRRQDFALVSNAGRPWAARLATALRERGRSVTFNRPFHLERDLARVPPGSPLERFNAGAVLVEMNDRHRGDAGVAADLLEAIGTLVGRGSTGPGSRDSCAQRQGEVEGS